MILTVSRENCFLTFQTSTFLGTYYTAANKISQCFALFERDFMDARDRS